MNFNTDLIGFKNVILTKMEKINDTIAFYLELPKKVQVCPACSNKTTKIHDYRIQKIKHLNIKEDKQVNNRPDCLACLNYLL